MNAHTEKILFQMNVSERNIHRHGKAEETAFNWTVKHGVERDLKPNNVVLWQRRLWSFYLSKVIAGNITYMEMINTNNHKATIVVTLSVLYSICCVPLMHFTNKAQ